VTSAEERAALVRLAGYMALVWLACAAVFFAWSSARSPAFDVRSPAGWVRGITVGEPAERARALVALGQSTMLVRVPCRVLVDRLHESDVVREAAMVPLIYDVRAGRCGSALLQTLTESRDPYAQEAAAQVLGAAGDTSARVRRALVRAAAASARETTGVARARP
jgi:hypothetical protein